MSPPASASRTMTLVVATCPWKCRRIPCRQVERFPNWRHRVEPLPMNKRIGKSPSVELQRLGGLPGSTAIVCVPYAGGGAAAYRSWPNLLGSVDVYVLSFPGRDARLFDPLFTTLDSLVLSIVDAIRPLTDRRYALFGHSMGGLLAYEAVRVLRRENATPPVHLFVSGIRVPHLPDPNPKIFDLPDNLFVEELCRFEATTLNVD